MAVTSVERSGGFGERLGRQSEEATVKIAPASTQSISNAAAYSRSRPAVSSDPGTMETPRALMDHTGLLGRHQLSSQWSFLGHTQAAPAVLFH